MTVTPLAPLRERRLLGVDLSQVSDVDTAIQAAGLDWGLTIVDASDITINTDEPVRTHIPGMRMVMRDDNDTVLGVVGSRYEPVDNRSVFTLAEHFIKHGAKFREGGALDHGRRCFMRFDLPDKVELVGGKDLVTFSLALKASHDGTGNVSAAVEGFRLICANGMTAKMSSPHVFQVRHTANASTRMAEAEVILSGAAQYARGFAAAAQHMLDTPMTRTEFSGFLDDLYPRPDETSKRATTIWENRRTELMSLFAFADTNESVRGTTWSAYNALTEYLDWEARVRSTDGSDVSLVRARRQFDATNQEVKDRGFALLTH